MGCCPRLARLGPWAMTQSGVSQNRLGTVHKMKAPMAASTCTKRVKTLKPRGKVAIMWVQLLLQDK